VSLVYNTLRFLRRYIGNGPTPYDILTTLKQELEPRFINRTDNDKDTRYDILKECINNSISYYTPYLGMLRQVVTKTAMGLAFATDLYLTLSFSPTLPFFHGSSITYVLFSIKCITETPSLIRYLVLSRDWYNLGQWILLKPINFSVPVVGPLFEAGVFERIVKQRSVYDAKRMFLERVTETHNDI